MANQETTDESIDEIRASLTGALDKARELHATGTHHQLQEASNVVVALQKSLSDTIASGASPCPRCGDAPHGSEHKISAGTRIFPRFEIGCLRCGGHRADGLARELAVANWNAGPKKWMEPKPGAVGPADLPPLSVAELDAIAAEREAKL